MKKSLVVLVLMPLLIAGGCATSGSNKPSKTDQKVTQVVQTPEQQFLRVIYTKDSAQVEFDQYMRSVGDVDSQVKQEKVQARYHQINLNTLNSLKKLKPVDPEVRSYLDSLINLAQLSEEVIVSQNQLSVEYQKNKKLSSESKQKLDTLNDQVQRAYASVMEKEVDLTQKYAKQASKAAVKDFMYTESILNNESIEISMLQQGLLKDSSIKSQVEFDKKAAVGLSRITSNIISSLKLVTSTDAKVAAYVGKLIEAYQTKLQIIKQKSQITDKQRKGGKIPQASIESSNRYQQLDEQISKMRIDLLNTFIN